MATTQDVIVGFSANDEGLLPFVHKMQAEMQALQGQLKSYESVAKKAAAATGMQGQQFNQAKAAGRGYRSGMAQLGYQIQDIAVQLQGGQNIGLIIGQQGSQIASVFGPGGIVAGAILAVGAALGTALVPSLFKSKQSTQELADEVMSLTEKLKYATPAQREFIESLQAEEIEKTKNRVIEIGDALVAAADAQEKLNRMMEAGRAGQYFYGATAAAGQLANATEGVTDLIIEQQNIQSAADKKAREEAQKLSDERVKIEETLFNTFEGFNTKAAEDQKKANELSLKETERAAKEQAEAEMMWRNAVAENEQRLYEGQLAMDANKRKIDEDALKKKQEQQKVQDDFMFQSIIDELAAKEEYRVKIDELNKAAAQSYGDLAGAVGDNLKEGSAAQRAAYAIQKGFAVQKAIMNMQLAISEASTMPPPANFVFMAQAAATGLSSIAGIKAVSFEGGGYTGSGARSGGMDGKGGFAAMLHPNETVIDHTKGQSAGVTVNFSIQANDTAGFDKLLQSRRGQIIGMINQAVNNRGRASIA